KPLLYLAIAQGRVVAMRSFFGVRWEAGPELQPLTALYADDLVIAREHRNRGLIARIMGTAMADLSAAGYDYLFNLSAGPVTFISSLSMGWHSAGPVVPMRWRSWRYACRSAARRARAKMPMLNGEIGKAVAARVRQGFTSLAETDPNRVAVYFDAAPS